MIYDVKCRVSLINFSNLFYYVLQSAKGTKHTRSLQYDMPMLFKYLKFLYM